MSFDEIDVVNRDSSTVLESYPNARLFNLYLDPKERFNCFNRQTFMDAIFTEPFQAHKATFEKYPGKKAMIEAKFEEFRSSKVSSQRFLASTGSCTPLRPTH